jgi:glycosyltransferase involved in cell wall biosynthesis
MQIIQIGPYPKQSSVVGGGVEAAVHGLSHELSIEHEIVVLDLPRTDFSNDFIEKGDVIIYRFSSKSGGYFSKLLRVFSYVNTVKNLNFDLVHIHTTTLFSLILYLLLKISSKQRICVTIHGLAHVEMLNKYNSEKTFKSFSKYIFQSFVEFSFINICSRFIVDTAYVELRLKEYKNEHKIFRVPRCVVIPQGIKQNYFNLCRTADKSMFLLAIGAFNRRKGHLKLLEAFHQVLHDVPEVRLDIAGTLSDLAYFNKMKSKINELNLSPHVTLHPNIKSEELDSLLINARIFVLHTEEESQGIVFCEAMAVGLPIVTTAVGGVPYVLEHEVNAMLSPYDDMSSFSRNIVELLHNPRLEESMSLTNREGSTKYDWKSIAELVLNEYKRIK